VADIAGWRRRSASDTEDLPLPGPARRYGDAGMILRYNVSGLLMMLNPFQVVQVIRQTLGNRERPIPSAAFDCRRPFDGEWLALNGGETPETSHSWEIVSQRYAYDFVIADETGSRHSGDGTALTEYYCYGKPIRAVAAGVVVRVREGVRDAPWVGTGWVDWLCRDFGGNAVTIRHADAVYSHYAHLVPDSIPVRVGDRVSEGEEIGRCGNSGHSTEPHLHFQLQDGPDMLTAAGLRVRFRDGDPGSE
jgi:murein DD-endopeptidase MepM/ murein hydrolase activator NlpD